MNWFYATKDKTQAGPVDEAALSELLRSGTITPETLIWKEGMENWKPYSTVLGLPAQSMSANPVTAPVLSGASVCAECGQSFPSDQLVLLAGRSVCSSCKPIAVQKLQEGVIAFGEVANPEELWQKVQARGFTCGVGQILSRSWKLILGNFWPCVGVTLLAYLIIIAANSIPFVNYLGMFLVQGQMMAGLNYYFVKQFRGEPATLNDSFAGFRVGYWRQALYMLIVFGISLALALVIVIPTAILIPLLSSGGRMNEAGGVLMVVAIIPMVLAIWYFIVCWIFVPLLIVDKGLKVLPAMKLSRRVVHLQFWQIVLLFLFFLVLALAGLVTVCLGFVVVLPLCFAMISRLYEDAFSPDARTA